MTSPLDYSVAVQSPFQAVAQGYQLGAGIRDDQFKQDQQQVALQQQQAAQAQQMQMQRALSGVAANPNATGDDYARLMTAYPALAEPLTKAWSAKNEAQQQSSVGSLVGAASAIKSGNPQVAADGFSQRADAIENTAGGPTPQSRFLRDLAAHTVQNPQSSLSHIYLQLSAIPAGQKALAALDARAVTNRVEGTTDADVKKAGAEADLARTNADVAAATAPDQVAAAGLKNTDLQSVITTRTKQFALDEDKFRSELGLKTAELTNKLGELPEFVAKDVTTSAADSIAAAQSASQMVNLAARIEDSSLNSGISATGAEWLKRVTGNQNEITRLRSQYSRIVTPAAMAAYKTVASGSTSDKDIETAMTGVPSNTADSATMASFLRGAAKLQVYDSVVNNAKSEWLQNVHSLGKASRDIQVDGVKVPAGTTFKSFTDAYVSKKVAAQSDALDVANRGYMKFAAPAAPPAPLADAIEFGSGQ
jgi:hypothetical protein